VFFATTDNYLIVYRPAKSNRPLFKWTTESDIQTIAVSETETYLGGHFSHMSRGATIATRSHLASLSTTSAAGCEHFEHGLVARDAQVCGDRLTPGRV
jgi:hypothetical protein